jgi:hypothetical protein
MGDRPPWWDPIEKPRPVDESLVCPSIQDSEGPSSRTGRRDPNAIQQLIRGRYSDFRNCYEKALARDPTAQGLLSFRFVIEPDGGISTVCLAKVTFHDGEAVDCIMAHFRSLRFPPADGIVTVVYPIDLEPG